MDGWTFVASAGTKFVFHALFCFTYYFDYFFTWFYDAMTNSHRDLIKVFFVLFWSFLHFWHWCHWFRQNNSNPEYRLIHTLILFFPQQSAQNSLSQLSPSSSSVSSLSQWTVQSGSGSAAGTTGGPGLTTAATEQDKKLKQYLEDERIALFLQNEEFMRELQRNHEFLIALEKGIPVHSIHRKILPLMST